MQSDTAQTLLSAWKDQRAVDHHCHPLRRWPFQLTALDLRTAFTEALDPELAERHVINTAGYQAALQAPDNGADRDIRIVEGIA